MNRPATAITPERAPVGNVVWTCDPRAVFCVNEHLYTFREAGMDRDHRRLSGHEFFRCRECDKPTYFFAVFSTSPDPHVTCYLISEDCWKEWMNSDESCSTQEMLYRIRDPFGRSYNPTFRPPRNG